MLAAVIAHPDHRQVFPLILEPILKQDSSCEPNGLKRLKDLDIRFIITGHKTDLKYLYEFYHSAKKDFLTTNQDTDINTRLL